MIAVDPPIINNITVEEVCSNDITMSWASTRNDNDNGLCFVILLSSNEKQTTSNTSKNFTGLIPNTNYSVTVTALASETCIGNPESMMITTSTVEAAKPSSKLVAKDLLKRTDSRLLYT